MNLLRAERDTLDSYLPGLDEYLSEVPLLELEQPGSGALARFRELGGPALLVPVEYEGKGASLPDAVRIQRAVGARSPSLAVATTMHHFSVASLVELTAAGNGFEWAMLMAIAENNWLLSSGFAEGKPGQHILTPTMRGEPADGGITVSGAKKPCSLHLVNEPHERQRRGRRPCHRGRPARRRPHPGRLPASKRRSGRPPPWPRAESDQITLRDVLVPDALIFYPDDGAVPSTRSRPAASSGSSCSSPRPTSAPPPTSPNAPSPPAAAQTRTAPGPGDRPGDDGRRPQPGSLHRRDRRRQRRAARAGALRSVRDRAGHQHTAMSAAAALGGMSFISWPRSPTS